MRFDENVATSSERLIDAFYMCITLKYVIFHEKKSVFQIKNFFRKNGVICCILMRFWCRCTIMIRRRKWYALRVWYMKISCTLFKKLIFKWTTFFEKKQLYLLYFNAILMPIYGNNQNAQMMCSMCKIHLNMMYFMKKGVVQMNNFFESFGNLGWENGVLSVAGFSRRWYTALENVLSVFTRNVGV